MILGMSLLVPGEKHGTGYCAFFLFFFGGFMNELDLQYEMRPLSSSRKKELEEFCRNLDLHFKNLGLLDLAFHHRSFSNENKDHRRFNNERLEFLGDSVLGLATAAFLYDDMAGNPEGDLAKIKSTVVSEKSLAPIALEKMHIDRYLVMGKGEELSGGRKKAAILADAVEAVIGALYLDSGYAAAEKLVLELMIPAVRAVQTEGDTGDYKTMLQEYFQKKNKACPVYELVSTSGPDHDRKFEVAVHLGNKTFGPAVGKSKKRAEQLVAKLALEKLGVL